LCHVIRCTRYYDQCKQSCQNFMVLFIHLLISFVSGGIA
jgi:hypothetical protein